MLVGNYANNGTRDISISQKKRAISVKLLIFLIFLLISYFSCYSQTSGPSQTEYKSYGSAEDISEMVDIFTGDFKYNIPILEIPGPNGGYPLVLNYSSNISMTQDASWVGFGWNLSPGVITRTVRGLPDDFNGVPIFQTNDIKDNITYGYGGSVNFEAVGADISAGLELGIMGYFNNFSGLGLRSSAGLSASTNLTEGSKLTIGGKINNDTQEGPSLSLDAHLSTRLAKFESSGKGSVNDKEGLKNRDLNQNNKPFLEIYGNSQLGSVNISSFPTFFPQITSETEGTGFNASFQFGGEVFWMFISGKVHGYKKTNTLKKRNQERSVQTYGYLYLEKPKSDNVLLDFNREKDGIIRQRTPNLAIPNITYDIYTVTGNEVGGVFRAYRNDLGILFDQKSESHSNTYGLGVDVGVGNTVKVGLNGNYGHSESKSGLWDETSNLNAFTFKDVDAYDANSLYEPYFFKFIGESNLRRSERFQTIFNHFNDFAARKPKLIRTSTGDIISEIFGDLPSIDAPFYKPDNQLIADDGSMLSINNTIISTNEENRETRGNTIQHFTNSELLKIENMYGEYHITYINENDDVDTLIRNSNSQIGAFKIHSTNGTKYIYALAAKNKNQIERHYSVDGTAHINDSLINDNENYQINKTECFYNEKRIPEYAYAYLLTSILGSDYIDADTIPGPSDGDLGYWIKFTYKRSTDQYYWRAPYKNANLNIGYFNHGGGLVDDKATVLLGEKELWYLKIIESKTHIAEFDFSSRKDGYGSDPDSTNIGLTSQSATSQKLDLIRLFSKMERFNSDGSVNDKALSLKSIHFNYDYELVPETPNSKKDVENPTGGKLTLKKLYFTYENSDRGSLSPYVFNYDTINPHYLDKAQDVWGTYRKYQRFEEIRDFPYSSQDKLQIDKESASWLVRSIDLPTGSTIEIDYESDTYSQVQNKPAMILINIAGLGHPSTSNIPKGTNPNTDILFKIENADNELEAQNILNNYLSGLNQLYFKVKMNLKEPANNKFEFISGYVKIKGGSEVEKHGSDYYGKIALQPYKDTDYHPFSIAAYQHLRLNQPQLISDPPFDIYGSSSDMSDATKIIDLIEDIPSMAWMFSSFNKHANDEEWGLEIDLNKSWIRLKEPLSKKFGGGIRVKSVKIDNNWDKITGEYSQSFGQEFIYENEDSSSNGVATYEPSIGGEENPFHLADFFTDDLPMSSDYNLFFEHPINESYFPSPSVGYGKVKVRSLVSDSINNGKMIYSKTGEIVYEYNTAKDFPTIVDETKIGRKTFNPVIFVPLIGTISVQTLIASQGYSVVLNDMHGKPKKTSYYGTDDKNRLKSEPESYTKYKYSEIIDFVGQGVDFQSKYHPTSYYDTLIENRHLIDCDHFIDMRHSNSYSFSAGINANADISMAGPIPIPIVVGMPNFSLDWRDTKTVVANKIINKYSVLTEIEKFTNSTITNLYNKAFDENTGEPVLSASINTFDSLKYNYNIPAHIFYPGLGPMYQNIDYNFTTNYGDMQGEQEGLPPNRYSINSLSWIIEKLCPGDEFVVSVNNFTTKAWVYYTEERSYKIFCDKPLPNEGERIAEFKLYHSGHGNQLNDKCGSIISLRNPLTEFYYDDITYETETYQNVNISYDSTLIILPQARNFLNELPWTNYTNNLNQVITEKKCCIQTCIRKLLSKIFYKNNAYNPNKAKFYVKNYDQQNEKPLDDFYNVKLDRDKIYFYFKKDPLKPYSLSFQTESGIPYQIDKIHGITNIQIEENRPPFVPNKFKDSIDYQKISLNIIDKNWNSEKVYVFSDYHGWYKDGLTLRPIVERSQESKTTTIKKLDDVISASATTYSDFWPVDQNLVKFYGDSIERVSQMNNFIAKSIYEKGSKGIWKPQNLYFFNEERLSSLQPDLRKDGVFNQFMFFDWNNGHQGTYDVKWLNEKEIIKYNPNNFIIESNNKLKIPTASLTGYLGSLNTAHSINSKYYELGFEGFEEYENDEKIDNLNIATSNIDFYTKYELRESYLSTWEFDYEVVGDWIVIPPPFDPPDPWGPWINPVRFNEIFSIELFPDNTISNNTGFANLNNSNMGLTPDNEIVIKATNFSKPQINTQNRNNLLTISNSADRGNEPGFNSNKKGSGVIVTRRPGRTFVFMYEVPVVSITNKIAHSGNNSLMVKNNGHFQQMRLKLIPGKDYFFSSWVSLSDPSLSTFNLQSPLRGPSITFQFIQDDSDNPNNEVVFKPSGPIIEGWQKIEGKIKVPLSYNKLFLLLESGIEDEDSEKAAFFDDIRIHPYDANLETYVFNPKDYKLNNSLDNNNYGTLYFYDEEGNLNLLKKETIKGISTISEHRFHMYERK